MKVKNAILPVMGVSMAAGAAVMMMKKPARKHKIQKTAGKALKAVGEAVEHYHGSFKM